MQIGCRQRGSALDDARKTNRDAIEAGQQLAQFVEAGQHSDRFGHGRRHHTLPLADRLAVGVEQHGLQARTAHIDGERDGAGWVGRGDGRRSCGRRILGCHQHELYCLRMGMQSASGSFLWNAIVDFALPPSPTFA